jgi:flagellar hook-length control protein FliK
METMSVAPLPGPVLPQPASAVQGGEDSAKPFEQALKEELAKPESDKAEAPPKAEEAKAVPAKAAETPPSKEPARTSEWAALLEQAGLSGEVVAEAHEDSAEELQLASETDAATDMLVGSETEANPLHPLIATPASARPVDTAVAPDKRTAAPVDARAKAEALDALAARSADAEALRGSSEKADAAASEALLASFAERVAASETASTPRSPGLDGLAANALATRWAAGQTTAANATAAQTPVTARIDTPLGASGWGEAFQQKIVWLVDRQQQSAELHINPPHLGPVEVSLSLGEDGTHVAFASPHAAVREAIEASLADLKTALGEKGLSLGQATVGADPQAAREQLQGEARGSSAGSRNRSAGDAPAELPLPQRMVQRGLVDIFA